MACLTLPPKQRLWGMILGAGVAVLLRVIFTLVIAQAMTYPYLKLVGGALLFYVAIKLVTEDADGDDDGVEGAQNALARGAHRRHRRHRDEPRQRDRDRGDPPRSRRRRSISPTPRASRRR